MRRIRPSVARGPAHGVVAVEGDVTDTASLTRACEGNEVVIDLARSLPTASRPGRLRPGQRGGPAALASAARAAGVRRIVHLAGIDTTTGEPGPYLAGRRRGDAASSPRALSLSRSCGRRSCSAAATRPSCARWRDWSGSRRPCRCRATAACACSWYRVQGRRALDSCSSPTTTDRGSSRSAVPTSSTYDEVLDRSDWVCRRDSSAQGAPTRAGVLRTERASCRRSQPAAHAGSARAVRERQHHDRRRDRAAVQLPPAPASTSTCAGRASTRQRPCARSGSPRSTRSRDARCGD